jgi:HSP20 family protein
MAKKQSGKVAVRKPAKPSQVPAPTTFANSLQALQQEIDRLFDNFSRGFGFGMTMPRLPGRIFDIEPLRGMERAFGASAGLVPSVDIAETDKEITVTAELPGLSEKDVEVVLSDDLLTIRGEKKVEKEEKKKNFYMSERSYGSFERSFRLPESVDQAKVQANFEKGVLTVRAPKRAGAEKAAGKKVAIKSKK